MSRPIHNKNWKLTVLINKHRLSASTVAENIGMSKTSIYSFINERRLPSIESAVKLAHFLHTNVSSIFEEVVSKNGNVIPTNDELINHPEYKAMYEEYSNLAELVEYVK